MSLFLEGGDSQFALPGLPACRADTARVALAPKVSLVNRILGKGLT